MYIKKNLKKKQQEKHNKNLTEKITNITRTKKEMKWNVVFFILILFVLKNIQKQQQ